MKLEELRKIAEARTKGTWNPDWNFIYGVPGVNYFAKGPNVKRDEKAAISDAIFIAFFANHADALLKVVEAAWKVVLDKDGASAHMNLRDSLLKLEEKK